MRETMLREEESRDDNGVRVIQSAFESPDGAVVIHLSVRGKGLQSTADLYTTLARRVAYVLAETVGGK